MKYWCVGGTLIGAAIYKGWIPHDADIDISMLKSDYEKFKKLIISGCHKTMPRFVNNYWFQDETTDPHYPEKIGKIRYLHAHYKDCVNKEWHNGLQVDIFIYDEKDDGILEPIPPYYEDDTAQTIRTIDKNIVFPLKKLEFENMLVYVPNDYEKYLTRSRGSYPPPPPPECERYAHEGRIDFVIPKWMIDKYPKLYNKK